MKEGAATFWKRPLPFHVMSRVAYLLLGCILVMAPAIRSLGEEAYGLPSPYGEGFQVKLAPRDQYELKFLGAVVSKDGKPLAQPHQGLFLFTWKGARAIEVDGYSFDEQKRFLPFNNFCVHHNMRWETLPGNWCGTGVKKFSFEPGRVVSLMVGVDWLEPNSNSVGRTMLQSADRAVLYLASTEGYLVSNEFPLPLIPKDSK